MNFYTELAGLRAYEVAISPLGGDQQEAMLRRLSDRTEVLDLARSLAHAEHQGAAREQGLARIRSAAQDLGVDMREVEDAVTTLHLAEIDPAGHLNRRNELLLQIDELKKRLPNTEGGQRVRLAEHITNLQMQANFHTTEAYVGPGAVKQGPATGELAYQAALSHLEMAEHALAEAGGDPVGAGREYELYKYMTRFAEAAEWAGVDTPQLRYLKHIGDYLYKVNREAHYGEGTIPEGKGRWSATDPEGPQPVVSEAFIREQTEMFLKEAYAAIPRIQRAVRQGKGSPASAMAGTR
jgi:hypothetical protein